MILNMIGGQRVQSVDFTLSSDTSLYAPTQDPSATGLEIENVYLPVGKFSGFAIWPTSSITLDNAAILHIYSPKNISNVSQSGSEAVLYTSVSGYFVHRDTSNSYAVYDNTNKKFTVKCGEADSHLKAGNYRLVIW